MTRRCSLAIVLGLPLPLLLCMALYWPGLAGPFLLDDWHNIVEPYVPALDWEEILYVSTHNESGPLGRPLSVLSFVLSGLAHGPAPWGYKYHNLLLHLCNGLLLFWLLHKLLPKLAGKMAPRDVQMLAGAAAAAWLLHPLMVSTVLYAVQRMAQLAATFTLLALLAYVAAREALGKGGCAFLVSGFLLLPLSLVLGLASKESAALIPLYVGAIEFQAFRLRASGSAARLRLFALLACGVVLPLLLGGAYVLMRAEPLADFSHRDFTQGQRLLTQLWVLGFYLKLILLPRLADLSLFHDDIAALHHFDVLGAALLAGFAAALYLMIRLRRKAPLCAFALAWFLIAHALESTFLDLELVFEHRNYLAALGPLMVLFHSLLGWRRGRWFKPLTLVILLLLSFLTQARVQEWSSAELLFALAVRDHPGSLRARLGYADLLQVQGRREEALWQLDAALALRENDFGPALHKAAHLCGTAETDSWARRREIAALLLRAERAAAQFPVSPHGLKALENLLVRREQGLCTAVSLEQLLAVTTAALEQPENRATPRFLGFLQRLAGRLHLLRGEHGRGLNCLVAAYRNTGLPVILAELIGLQIGLQRLEDASLFLAELERVNSGSGGLEAHLLKPLRESLALNAGESQP